MQFDMEPKKGHSYIHLITTGAGETYGSNSNGDYFNKTARMFETPEGGIIKLAGGLHYNSKKGAKSLGNVVLESVNPVMNRGELIIELDNNKWANSLNKLASNQSVTFSMGCGVPYDICSICATKAPTRRQYCNHLKYAMGQMDKEGNMVFAINDQPHFHDISEVGVPADKIAHGLRKVASTGCIETVYEEQAGMYIPVDMVEKIASNTESKRYSIIHKLAEMEKRIETEGIIGDGELAVAEACPCNPHIDDSSIVNSAKNKNLDEFLGALHENDVMLPPKTFIRIVSGKPDGDIPGLTELPNAVKDIFSHLVESGNMEDIMNDSSYYPKRCLHDPATRDLGKSLAEQFSLGDAPLQGRVVSITIRRKEPRSLIKVAARCRPKVSAEARYLATEYAKYQLSFLANSTNDTLVNRVGLLNCS
jgi:hypothetical protein